MEEDNSFQNFSEKKLAKSRKKRNDAGVLRIDTLTVLKDLQENGYKTHTLKGQQLARSTLLKKYRKLKTQSAQQQAQEDTTDL